MSTVSPNIPGTASKGNDDLASELADTQLLQDISTELIRQDSVDSLYEKLVDAAAQIMRADFATMQRLHSDKGNTGELCLLTSRGFASEHTRAFQSVPLETPTTCCVALRSGQRVVVQDFEQCDFMAGTDALAMHLRIGIHAAQSTPLIARNGKTVGMITTHWRTPHSPSARHLRLFDVLARQAADLIEHSETETRLRNTEQQLRQLAEQLEELVAQRTHELVQAQNRLRDLAIELTLTEQGERKRLAIELHDHLQQLLILGKLKIGQSKRLSPPFTVHTDLMQDLDRILSDALAYTRTLVTELSPAVLQEHGLFVALKWLGDHMKQHGLQTVVNTPSCPGSRIPEAHALLLFQSVRELLVNAAKYAGTHEAFVTVSEEPDALRIQVRDHGQGFDASRLESAPSIEATTGASSKFGLFSIRERMHFLGGSLQIQSREHAGTTATLVLPRSSASPVPTGPLPERTILDRPPFAQTATRVIRVLLVDDHAMVRQGLRTLLESYNDVDVVGDAANGEEALALVERFQPTVVVMDINMPTINGIEATRQIKAPHPDTIVVGLSVNAEQENQRRCGSQGALSF